MIMQATASTHFRTGVFATTLALLALVLSPNALSKDFYKWQDEQGVTHYSAHPPRGDKASTKIRATNIKGKAAPAKSSAPKNEAPAATKPTSVEKAASKKDPQACKRARTNLKTLQEHGRVRVKEGDDYRFLSDEEHKANQLRAKKEIKTAC